ncbi:MFS transporter [Quisquiliibacterium transsilvanicum]|uniref:MFS family permease n=1 Tax=Quisquiliibacterium transsilvanicum TaxID=1549638 RepID=A0A7W8HH36_9BURK|nr:MFS transporter [Quisquiliibacterium transsilvanicum]MBB5271952.1 MFS family permease [Quisquiliibacterium transsilvanicum]
MTPADRARLGLAIVFLGVLVGPLDTTVNTAFPVITEAFSLPLRDIQWVVIPFVVAQSAASLVFGHLGDRLGHRRVFALGLAASALAHAAAAMAPDYPTLVAMRGLQGAAVGIAVACAPALATLLFPAERKAAVLALYAAVFSLGMALGPWLGGLLLAAGWPAVFWFRVPLSLLALALMPLMPQGSLMPQRTAGRAAFDWPGALGLPAVFACLALGIAESTRPGAGASGPLLLLLGLAGGVLFARHESRAAHPVLRMAPFRSLRFSGLQAASVAVSFACFANLLLLPYVLTREAGLSIAVTGLLLSAYPAGSVVGSLLFGRVARRWPAHRAMAIGLGVASGGLLLLAGLLSWWPLPSLMVVGMLASGIGQGVFGVGYMDATTSMLPVEERGVAGSLVNVTRLLGVVLGATLIGWLQGQTGHSGASFGIVGGGLAVFALAFGRLLRGGR